MIGVLKTLRQISLPPNITPRWGGAFHQFVSPHWVVPIQARANKTNNRIWIDPTKIKALSHEGITLEAARRIADNLYMMCDLLEEFGRWPTKEESEGWIEEYLARHTSQT